MLTEAACHIERPEHTEVSTTGGPITRESKLNMILFSLEEIGALIIPIIWTLYLINPHMKLNPDRLQRQD